MPPTVVVVQKTIPPYRIDFFHRVGTVLAERGYRLIVAFGQSSGPRYKIPDADSSPFHRLPSPLTIPLDARGVRDRLVVPRGLFSFLSESSPKVVVCGDVNDLFSGLVCRRYGISRRVPYLVWGLGVIPGKGRSPMRAALSPLIRRFHGSADGFLAYSDFAAAYYRSISGQPVHTVYNSCVCSPGPQERRDLLSLLERKYCDGHVLLRILFMGTLTAQKRVDVLLRSMARFEEGAVRLDVVGEGPLRHALEAEARRLVPRGSVTFHGAIYDTMEKRGLIDGTHLGVLPGLGGLALQEMAARGVPVVCSYADGTEIDLVKGPTPALFLERLDEETLAEAIESFRIMSPLMRLEFAIAALSAVEEKYNLATMVERFASAVVSHDKSAG